MSIEILSKVKFRKSTHTIESKNIPMECEESIAIPCYGGNFQHFYYIVNFKKKTIISYKIDATEIAKHIIDRIKGEYSKYPWNHRTIEQYVETSMYPHSIDVCDGKLIGSGTQGFYFYSMDIQGDSVVAFAKQDNALISQYSSTNMILNKKMYYSRWMTEDSFKKVENREVSQIPIEVGIYDFDSRDFKTARTLLGPDDIHATAITPHETHVILVEMCQNPRIAYPLDLDNAPKKLLLEILDAGLCDSHIYSLSLESDDFDVMEMGCSPAHIEFDKNDSSLFYILQHNNSMVLGKVLSFGNAKVNKMQIKDNKLKVIACYDGNELYRSPSVIPGRYGNKDILLCPCFMNKIHILDSENMSLFKNIEIRKTVSDVDYSNGPFAYPPASKDRTPFTVYSAGRTSILYLVSLWGISLYDFESGERIENINFNQSNDPIYGLGHAYKFIDKKEGV